MTNTLITGADRGMDYELALELGLSMLVPEI